MTVYINFYCVFTLSLLSKHTVNIDLVNILRERFINFNLYLGSHISAGNVWSNLAMRNLFSQNKSTIVYIYIVNKGHSREQSINQSINQSFMSGCVLVLYWMTCFCCAVFNLCNFVMHVGLKSSWELMLYCYKMYRL
jgi:hypothetical protein